ncbi:hypothetical protein AB4Z43_12830 [Mesorhizobium sp. 2RAF45]|uniref:hypothetical protein n=1 Tax=Mesorhizobium sp. 2RAF45 TaxID=3233001 RepID=UPI003F9CD49F
MQTNLFRFILAVMLLPLLWTAAGAQTVSFPDLGSALPGRSDVTYLDLAKLVIPSLASDGNGFYKGGLPIEMRHVEGPDSGGSPPETSSFPNAAVLPIRAGGQDRLAMLFDLGDSPDSAEAMLCWRSTTSRPSRNCSMRPMSRSTAAPIFASRTSSRSAPATTC